MNVSKRLLTLLMSLLVLAVLASVSLAGPGSIGRSGGTRDAVVETDEDFDDDTCDTTDEGEDTTDEGEDTTDEGEDTTDEGEDTTDEGEDTTDEGEDTTDEGEECEGDDGEGDDGEGDDGEGDDGEEGEDTDEGALDREEECLDAARIEPSEGDDATDDEAMAHGLDNAIEHLLANCVKNPQAPGLLVALDRLAENLERHQDHEQWKAERKAERDAAKAERKAEHAGTPGHGKGHGGDGEHGNPHDGGSGGSQGGGQGHGGGGSHGNGHH